MIAMFFRILFILMIVTKTVRAENHLTDINVDQSFMTAVKLVEKKQYIDAVNIFNVLAQQGFLKHSLIYHSYYLMGWAYLKILSRL